MVDGRRGDVAIGRCALDVCDGVAAGAHRATSDAPDASALATAAPY